MAEPTIPAVAPITPVTEVVVTQPVADVARYYSGAVDPETVVVAE